MTSKVTQGIVWNECGQCTQNVLNKVIYATHMTYLLGLFCSVLLSSSTDNMADSTQEHGINIMSRPWLHKVPTSHARRNTFFPCSWFPASWCTRHESRDFKTVVQCPVYVHTRSTDHGSLVTTMHPSGIAEYAIHGRHQTFSWSCILFRLRVE